VEADLARGMVESTIWVIDRIHDEMRDVRKREGIDEWADAIGKTEAEI